MTELAVIIPTHSRLRTLARCLGSVARQTLPKNHFQVVIVADGSPPAIFRQMKQWEGTARFALKVLRNPGRGPAAARNFALQQSEGECVLILNDDVILIRQHFERHLHYHGEHPGEETVVRGNSLWHPDLPRNSLMNYMRRTMLVFDAEVEEWVRDLAFFHTMDLSFKRSLLEENSFDEEFPYPSMEDTELGWRLKKQGKLKMIFAPDIISYHDHRIGLRSFLRRASFNGYSAALVLKKHPELKPLLWDRYLWSSQRQRAIRIIKNLLMVRPSHIWGDLEDFIHFRALRTHYCPPQEKGS